MHHLIYILKNGLWKLATVFLLKLKIDILNLPNTTTVVLENMLPTNIHNFNSQKSLAIYYYALKDTVFL